jgi:N-acetylglutamate synthase/N-acetylornithine aminotransferase
VLTNAGQANAATGDQGYEDAVNCATITAASLGVSPDDVLLMSTGKRSTPHHTLVARLLSLSSTYSS